GVVLGHLPSSPTRRSSDLLPTAESAARLSRRHGMNHHLADSLALAGEIHLSAGRVPEAVAILEESVGLWRTRGWPSFLADALDRSEEHTSALQSRENLVCR